VNAAREKRSPIHNRPRQRDLLLGSDFLRRAEALTVAAGRLQATGGVASRAGTIRGGRVEFLDHRGYVEGDDLRDLDWNVYARTSELFTKVFGAEREKHVHLLLDLSPSMSAVPGKELFACRLAAALAHIALAAGDTVQVLAAGLPDEATPCKGLPSARDVVRHLECLPVPPPVDWARVRTDFATRRRPPGATVVISDFWSAQPLPALAELVKRRQDVSLLHVLTPEEISPPLSGHVRLEDAESGEEVSLALTERDLDVYRAEVENHLVALAASARRHGMRHLLCRTDVSFEHLVLTVLRRGGLLR